MKTYIALLRSVNVGGTGKLPMAALVQTGLAFLQNLAAVSKGGADNAMVMRDENTGAQYLKLPMPQPEVLQQLMTALSALLPAAGK